MAQSDTQRREYWVDNFELDQSDLDHLYSILLEQETPLLAEEMALVLVRHRVQQEQEAGLSIRLSPENQYDPKQVYKAGDTVAFSSMDYATGKVAEVRPGDNPDYGSYSVLRVEFDDGSTAEFASEFSPEHLQTEEPQEEEIPQEARMSPEEIFIEWGGAVAETLEERLKNNPDLVRLAGRWFPKSLLANVNSGHLNLAEAVLDMYGGGPMATHEIIDQAGMLQNVNPKLAEFSLNYGLQEDGRFDEVGAAGKVIWFLTRLEPEGVQRAPERLEYVEVSSDDSLLTPELRDIEQLIGDEHSSMPVARSAQPPQSVTVTLIYPHQRSGTLPLSPQLRTMFPTAYRSERIFFTLVDAESGEEYPAWVVRPGGYVYGLGRYFEQHEIPVGSYLTIERTKDPSRVKLSAGQHKARKEWVRSASVQNNRLRFESVQRPVGAAFDDLMIIDVPDPEQIDTLWRRVRERKTPLEDLMADVMRDLAALTPQGHVHAKTLYSALNLIRRTPPGPIFARLVALPEFEHAGGPYWRIGAAESEA